MDSYKVRLKKSAEEEFRGVPFPVRRQLNQRFGKLKTQPWPPEPQTDEWQSLSAGHHPRFRLRAYGYKVLYEIDEGQKVVTIFAILPLSSRN